MWAQACALLDEAERRHRRFFDLLAVPAGVPAWEPPANIFAHGSDVRIEIALPGARADDIVVQLAPAGLLIEAMVAPPAFSAGVEMLRLEIPYGRMRRRIELPPGRYSLCERRLENGYLFVRLTGSIL